LWINEDSISLRGRFDCQAWDTPACRGFQFEVVAWSTERRLLVKRSLILAGTAVLLCGVMGCGGSADSLVRDQIRTMNDLADAIEKKDDARAKDLQEKLKATEKKLQELKLSDEQKKELISHHQEEIQKAVQRLTQAAMKRTLGEGGKMFGGPFPGIPAGPGK
jgi:hypothetical protein